MQCVSESEAQLPQCGWLEAQRGEVQLGGRVRTSDLNKWKPGELWLPEPVSGWKTLNPPSREISICSSSPSDSMDGRHLIAEHSVQKEVEAAPILSSQQWQQL